MNKLSREERAKKQAEVCAWFRAKPGWSCAYVRLKLDGRLDWYQDSGPAYCEAAHYRGADVRYSWTGRSVLRWEYDSRAHRGRLYFLGGKPATRAAHFAAVVVLPTTLDYHPDKKGYAQLWTGRPAELWWYRERADYKRFEEADKAGKRVALSHKMYQLDGEKRFYVPAGFERTVRAELKDFPVELLRSVEDPMVVSSNALA